MMDASEYSVFARGFANLGSQFSPGLFHVIGCVDVKCARIRPEFFPDIGVHGDVEFRLNVLVCISKCVDVAGGGAIHEPGDALNALACVNDFDLQLFSGAVVERLELHKHAVADF